MKNIAQIPPLALSNYIAEMLTLNKAENPGSYLIENAIRAFMAVTQGKTAKLRIEACTAPNEHFKYPDTPIRSYIWG